MSRTKLVIVDKGFNSLYEEFIKQYVFPKIKTKFIEFNSKSAKNIYPDLILFTGGTDVNPDFYLEDKGKYTDIPNDDRDMNETTMFSSFPNNILKLGICRGSQLLCALSGGNIIQHVEGHNHGNHNMSYNFQSDNPLLNSKIMTVPSDHHQMMYPYSLNNDRYEILGWSTRYMGNTYLNGKNEEYNIDKESFFEPEIVYFNNTNSLSIQFHPEYSSFQSGNKALIGKLIYKYIHKK